MTKTIGDHDRIVHHIEADEQTEEIRGIRRRLRDHAVQREDDHRPPDNQAGHLREVWTMWRLTRWFGRWCRLRLHLILAHRTTTFEIHLVWRTPGRSGAISRIGYP